MLHLSGAMHCGAGFPQELIYYLVAFIFLLVWTITVPEEPPHSMMVAPPCITVGITEAGDEQWPVLARRSVWSSAQRV